VRPEWLCLRRSAPDAISFSFLFSCALIQSDRYADIIVPWHDGPHNDIAIEILVQHINTEVYKRGLAPQPPAETPAVAEKPTAIVPTKRKNL